MILRNADLQDLPTLLTLSYQMFSQTPMSRHCKFSPEQMASTLISLIQSSTGSVLVTENSGEIIGLALVTIEQSYFSSQRVAKELGVYVHPDHRVSGAGLALLRHFKQWSLAKQADLIEVGNIANIIDSDRYEKVLSRLGLKHSGNIYEMRL